MFPERLEVPGASEFTQWCVDRLVAFSEVLQKAVAKASRIHLGLFYLFEAYFHISKRVTALRYVMIHHNSSNPSGPDYRLLGMLIVAQLGMSLARWVWTTLQARNAHPAASAPAIAQPEKAAAATLHAGDNADDPDALPTFNCPLCLW